MSQVLEIENLQSFFNTPIGFARAVDDVSLNIPQGKLTAIVGESGCGKSALSLSILDLLPKPAGMIQGGSIKLLGENVPLGDEQGMRQFRGSRISMIFQDPMTSLNPVQKIGKQIQEMIDFSGQHLYQAYYHKGKIKDKSGYQKKVYQDILDLFGKVGIADAERRFHQYPHELSGGQRQRVMIAMAISCKPRLLIADEPTTALDVTIQAQIMELLLSLRVSEQMSVLFITHNLNLVCEYADTIYVMYAGKLVESGSPQDLMQNAKHPYTHGLFHSIPGLAAPGKKLNTIPGRVPPATEFPEHQCRFAPRCEKATDECKKSEPRLKTVADDSAVRKASETTDSKQQASEHQVACFHPV